VFLNWEYFKIRVIWFWENINGESQHEQRGSDTTCINVNWTHTIMFTNRSDHIMILIQSRRNRHLPLSPLSQQWDSYYLQGQNPIAFSSQSPSDVGFPLGISSYIYIFLTLTNGPLILLLLLNHIRAQSPNSKSCESVYRN